MVASCFGSISPKSLDELTVACCLFSDAIVSIDDSIDLGLAPHGGQLPNLLVLVSEALQLLARLLGDDATFWGHFNGYLGEYVDALAIERRVARGHMGWEDCTEEICWGVIRGKNGLVRTIAAALASVSGDDRNFQAIERILLDFLAAGQLVDDLRDWKDDVATGAMSLLLCLASKRRPRTECLNEIGRSIYANGHAEATLTIAEALFVDLAKRSGDLGAIELSRLFESRAAGLGMFKKKLSVEIGNELQ